LKLIFPTATLTETGTVTPLPVSTATRTPEPYPEPGSDSSRLGVIFLVGSLWVLLAGWLVLILRKLQA
jgi:hypothetical protein